MLRKQLKVFWLKGTEGENATNTVYRPTWKTQANIRKVLSRLSIKMLPGKNNSRATGIYDTNSTGWIFITIARFGVHAGVRSGVRGRLVLPAGVVGRSWVVRR
jgi:hypothetical protein